jgi:hypothetical protein
MVPAMRFLPFAALLLAACTQSADPGDASVGIYRGGERDGLCVARDGEGLKAGLITYGRDSANCSLSGRAEVRGEVLVITPRGESDCSVEIRIADGAASIGARSRTCDYYCGPGADYAGRVLRKAPGPSAEVNDLAGDPLC